MAPAILSGGRLDGTQQRLRYGLGEHKPYRYRGKPGWNPARVLEGQASRDRMDRDCGKCGAAPGEPCRTKAGKLTRNPHTSR